MKVSLLTEIQKNILLGKECQDDVLFNPIQDADGNWIISTQEVNGCTSEEFAWVKELPLIDFVPKPEQIHLP